MRLCTKKDISCTCEEKAKADASIDHNWHRFDFNSCSPHRFGEERAYSISGLYITLLIDLKRCIVFAVMHNREGVRKNLLFGHLYWNWIGWPTPYSPLRLSVSDFWFLRYWLTKSWTFFWRPFSRVQALTNTVFWFKEDKMTQILKNNLSAHKYPQIFLDLLSVHQTDLEYKDTLYCIKYSLSIF